MAKLTYAQALEQVQRGKIEPAYLFLGEDYYQRFLLTEKIIQQRLQVGERVYNKRVLSGNKATPAALEEALFGVPLLGGNTMLIVTDVDRLPQASQQFLPRALKSLDAGVTFIGSARKLDGRITLTKALTALSTVVEIKELYDNMLPGYVQSRFSARGFAADSDAVAEFCRVVGKNCGDIENEVEKISIVYAGKKKVTLSDIRNYLSESRFYSQYEVADQLAYRRLKQSLTAVNEYLESSGSDGRGSLFWALYNQFERMLIHKKLSHKLSSADLAGRLRLHPFLLQGVAKQAALHESDALIDSLLAVYQAEVDDRFTTEAKQQIFERMIIRILKPAKE
jgi:DNA polymerase III delta subunit